MVLYATATTASDSRVYLEASDKCTDGIVLQTDDISEVFALKVRDFWFLGQATKYLHHEPPRLHRLASELLTLLFGRTLTFLPLPHR